MTQSLLFSLEKKPSKKNLILLSVFVLISCVITPQPVEPPVTEINVPPAQPPVMTEPEPDLLTADSDGVFRQKTTFSELPGWQESNLNAAFQAFLGSCKKNSKQTHWTKPCSKADQVSANLTNDSNEQIRTFFETEFTPYALSLEGKQEGLLTAYYEPELQVSYEETAEFTEPILPRPDDLVTVTLRRIDASLPDKIITGRVENGKLEPYYKRSEIRQAIGPALAWGRPIDVFFLQIQGSGRIKFNDGQTARAAFAGHNNRKYRSIGRELISRGELKPGKASKAAIENWMKQAGLSAAQELMNTNPRYVFFQKQPINNPLIGPKGTQGVSLIAKASLAIDPSFHVFGSPIWIDSRLPSSKKDWQGEPKQFLAIAQDTGGAIKGALRGDLFYGSGEQAGNLAGIQKHPAKWWVLMPNELSQLRDNAA